MAELTLLHVHRGHIGYGRLGQELQAALEARGVAVYDRQEDPHGTTAWIQGGKFKPTNVVCWVSTPTHAAGWYDGQHASVFTMWEATRLPEDFRANLHEFDTLIVPSLHNLELFSQYHPNVRYCPLGVNPDVWHPVERKDPGAYFRFLTAGSGARKGTDLAYKAFTKVFRTWPKGGPIPRLQIKSPKGGEFIGERVEVIGGYVSADAEVALYENANCYVQPARGEGFGLQPLQAIAQACPTILTNAHGHAAFADLGYPLDWQFEPSAYFIYGDSGTWWEPDFEQLCEQMWWVYHHYDEAREYAARSARTVAREWTWARTAETFVDCFDGALDRPYTGSGDWHAPEAKRYLVITNKPWTADIAGVTYFFEKGKEYYEVADVKRILFEAGLLDPRCVEQKLTIDGAEIDLGLVPEQYERIADYTAAHSHCPTCGHSLREVNEPVSLRAV